MAALDSYLDFVPAVTGLIGGALGYEGNKANAASARETAQSDLDAAAMNASRARAAAARQVNAGTVGASEEMRQAMIVNSTALARAAASGAGASDPTIINLMAQTEGRGAYLAGLKMYSAEEQSRQLLDTANADLYEGALNARANTERAGTYDLGADAALLKGVSPLSAKYSYGDSPTKAPRPAVKTAPAYNPEQLPG